MLWWFLTFPSTTKQIRMGTQSEKFYYIPFYPYE